jgi:hypothetical protein
VLRADSVLHEGAFVELLESPLTQLAKRMSGP